MRVCSYYTQNWHCANTQNKDFLWVQFGALPEKEGLFMVHLTTALDAASGVPLYEQLYRSLAAEMRTGAISAGTRMPGKR